MNPENHDLPDVVAFNYENSIALDLEEVAVSSQRISDQQYRDSDEDDVMREKSSKRLDSEKSGSELSAFMLEAGYVLENDCSKK